MLPKSTALEPASVNWSVVAVSAAGAGVPSGESSATAIEKSNALAAKPVPSTVLVAKVVSAASVSTTACSSHTA